MALTETTEYDKIEVVGPFKVIQIRKAIVIKRDGVEIPNSRSFVRTSLTSDQDISAQPDEIKAVCNAVWTDAVKKLWTDYQASLSQT